MATCECTLEGLLSLQALYVERGRIERAQLAPLTETGYANDWRAFSRWTASRGLEKLPATADTVTLFATEWLSRGRKTSTIRRLVAGISYMHRREGIPVNWTERVDSLLAGARRLQPETLSQAAPLTVEDLRKISEKLKAENTARALRNRAMLITGFCGALRSASIVALQLGDVEFEDRGAILHIRREKNDQAGRGRLIGLPLGKHPETCPVGALRDWIAKRTSFDGPLFTHITAGIALPHALTSERVGIILQQGLAKVQRPPQGFSSHSLRAGAVTAAGEQNVSELIIARTTGHRDLGMVRRYFRRRDAFAAALSGFLDL